ncbi:hypothetical protein C0991_006719 [Blastosporella zonata]|nr:hypothetical protein C0991_006719 [Blastosporella zonata]
MPLLPNPWAGDKPQSIEQPGIVVNLRTFHNIHKRCHHGFTYPYELMEEKPDKIPFYEILGRGPPPSDVPGNPGDIYVDLSNPSKIMVYIRGSEQWLSWNTPPGLDGKSTPVYLAHHPLLEDRYLWRTLTTQGLSWVTEKTIKSVGILPQLTVDPSGQISDAYAKIIAGGEFCLRVGGRQTQLSSLPTAPSCTVSSLNPKKRKIDNSHSNINCELSPSSEDVSDILSLLKRLKRLYLARALLKSTCQTIQSTKTLERSSSTGHLEFRVQVS